MQIAAVNPAIDRLRTKLAHVLAGARGLLQEGVEVRVGCEGGDVVLALPGQPQGLRVPFTSFLGPLRSVQAWGFVVPSPTPLELALQEEDVQGAHEILTRADAVVRQLGHSLRQDEECLMRISRLSQGARAAMDASLDVTLLLQKAREDEFETVLLVRLIPGNAPIVQLRQDVGVDGTYRSKRHELATHEDVRPDTPLRQVGCAW